MNDVIRKAFEDYAKIPPSDLQDTEVHMSTDTAYGIADNLPHLGFPDHAQLLGLPVRIDDNLPNGVVRFVTETELDRVIRRAGREGNAARINVMRPIPFPEVFLPAPPKPILKALLKHWLRKVKR